MTDTDAAGPETNGAEAPEPGIRILAQFIRDLSFENPRAPESLRAQNVAQPQIEMGVEMNARGRDDGLFEVDLKLSARATRSDGPLFIVELLYGGVFQIGGVPNEEMEPVLLIECPRYLFPFARQVIGDAVRAAGFPQLLLEPVDFNGIYLQQLAAQQEQGEGAGAPAGEA